MDATSTDEKIRVVSLINHLGRGGTERQLYLLTTHLDKGRFSCDVIVFNPSNHVVYDDALRKAGVSVWYVPAKFRSIPSRMWFVYRKLRELQPDIVHSWTVHDNPYAGIVGRLAGVPLCWGSLRSSLHHSGFRKLPSLIRFMALHSVSRLVVNTRSTLRELVRQRNISLARISHVPNCVLCNSCSHTSPDLSSFDLDDGHRLIGFVGNLRRVKKPQMFVDVMARVVASHSSARGLIVGQPISNEPQLPGQLAAQIEELGLHNKVIMAGFRDDVMALMDHFEVMAITSRSEGMPNVLLEAMSAACPVVATRVGGIPEVIEHGVTGLLVEPDDVDGLVAAIEELLSNPSLARKMGSAGQELVRQRFSCQDVSQQLADMYQAALQGEGNDGKT